MPNVSDSTRLLTNLIYFIAASWTRLSIHAQNAIFCIAASSAFAHLYVHAVWLAGRLQLIVKQKHGACSEDFYKQTITQHIDDYQTNDPEEKQAMLDILKRISDGDAADETDSGSEGDEEGAEDLISKLKDIDICGWLSVCGSWHGWCLFIAQVDSATLEAMLTPEQLGRLQALIQDEYATHQLLNTLPSSSPWWAKEQAEEDDSLNFDLVPKPVSSALIPQWDKTRDASKFSYNLLSIM